MKRLSIAMSLALLVSACEGDHQTGPTSPGVPGPTYTLSGVVSARTPEGLVPLEGVRVEEANSRLHATTDSSGFYTISGLRAVRNAVSASKPGYVTDTRPLTISGDTRVDIQIARVVTYTLSGVVFELTPAGRVPIEGVELYCDGCGSEVGHTFVFTDANGFYSLSWVYLGVQTLLVSKAGYKPVGQPQWGYTMTVTGDTVFDIHLVRQ